MSDVPDYPLGETIDFKFTSRAFSTGIPTTLAGTPAVEIYEDNSLTQITAAETLTVDFDGVTGLNNLRIVATSGNGFEAGKSYQAVMSAGTVDSVSVVGEVVAQFSIQRSPVNWANVTAPTTAVDLSATDIQLCDTITTYTGNTVQTGDSFARLGAPAGASVSADIADVPTVAEFNARTLVAASYFDPAADTVANVTTVATLTGHTAQTGDNFARLGAPAGASVSADVAAVKAETALVVADTNELQTDWANGGRLDVILDAILVDTGTTLPATLATLATSAALATVDTNVDAILVDTGTTIPATLGTPAGADMAADIAAVKVDTAAILVDTGTTLPATLATAAALATVDTNVDAILVDTATTIPGLIATAQADLDTITGTGGALLATGQTASAWSSLEASAGQIIEATVDTVTNTHTPTTTEFQADDITEATADHYNGRIVIFTSGVLAGQATDITDYAAVGGIGQLTVTALTEAPSNNDTFIIV